MTANFFCALIEDRKYPNLKHGEAAFSSMKIILTKLRNKMNDQHLADLLRIKEYKGEVNLEKLLSPEEN